MADVRWSIWDGSHQMGLRRFNNRPLSKTSFKTTKNLIVDPCNPNMGESSKGVTKRRKSEQQGWICVENLNTCKEKHWARETLILCLKFFSEDLSAFLKATPSLPSSILYALFTTFTLDIYCFLVAISMSILISRSLKVYLNVQWLYHLHHHLRLLHGGLRHLHLGSHRLLGWNRNKSIKWNNINLN